MKSIVIALAGTTIALTLAAFFGTFPVAAAEKSPTYTDPVEYCRVFGTVDYPGQRYRGPPTPEWIVRAMGSTEANPGMVDWRCMDGQVFVCIDQTMSGHGCGQFSLGRTPGPEQWAYCRQNPNSDGIPFSVMGWGSAYIWDCAGRVPRAHQSALRLDRRGFIPDEWSAVVPSLLEDDREWLAHLPDKYREQVLSMPAAQVAAYKQNGSWKLFRSDIDELVRNDAALTTGETATPSVTAGSRAAVVCKEMVAKAWVLVRNGRRIEDGNLDLEQVLDCFDDKAETSRFMDAVDAVEVMASLKTLPITPIHVSSGFFDPNYPPSEERQHLGIDLLAPVGTSVVAPEDGDVVFNNTAMATVDVDKAYLVIRNGQGAEHVLGHIESRLLVGAHVVARQEVGLIRAWPGEPGRSHLHWGVNTHGVAQAMRDNWGWGRAPVTATEAEATARGWVNFNSLVGNPTEQASVVNSDPVAYCRAFSAVDAPDDRYVGPAVPDWVYRSLDRVPSDAGRVTWRCAGGTVVACADASDGSNRRCKKPTTVRIPNDKLLEFCSQPGANGRYDNAGSIYTWQCEAGIPVIKWRDSDNDPAYLDAQGFRAMEWKQVTPALAASRPIPMDSSARMRSEEPCYQALRAAMLANVADGKFDSAALSTCTPEAFQGHRGPAQEPPENAAPGEWCFQIFRNARLDLDAGSAINGWKYLYECTTGGNVSEAWERADRH